MDTKVIQRPVFTKHFKKALLKTEKIHFGTQMNKGTGEIIYKSLQATFYVPDGNECPYVPQIGLSLKLGSDRLQLIVEDADDIEKLFYKLAEFTSLNKSRLGQVMVQERTKYINKILALKKAQESTGEQQNLTLK